MMNKSLLLKFLLLLFMLNTTYGQTEQELLAEFAQDLEHYQHPEKSESLPAPMSEIEVRQVAQQLKTSPPKPATEIKKTEKKPSPKIKAPLKPLNYTPKPVKLPPPPPSPIPNSMQRKTAFDAVTQQAFPMTPKQIRHLKKMMVASQRASAEPAESPPKPVTKSLFVNLAPNATPPVIRLYHGFVSSLVFVDSAAKPWPIASFDNGNPQAFNITWDKKSNTLMVQPLKAYIYGNLAITLKGLNTPVMLTLIPGQRVTDYRVDLRVPGLAPDSKKHIHIKQLPDNKNRALQQTLNGVGPDGGRILHANGIEAKVWLLGQQLYIRSHATLLSPGYISAMSSSDGSHAYQLQKTPSILVLEYGKPKQVSLEGI